MKERRLAGKHVLLRIVVGESDKAGGKSLYWTILDRARRLGVAGCTVLRGIAGFGASSVVHKAQTFGLSADMPIVIEIVDTKEQVDGLLKDVEPLLGGALVTEEAVEVRHYRGGR